MLFTTIEASQIKMIYKVKGLIGIIRNKNIYTLLTEAKIDEPVFQHNWQCQSDFQFWLLSAEMLSLENNDLYAIIEPFFSIEKMWKYIELLQFRNFKLII